MQRLGKIADSFALSKLPATVVGISDDAFRECKLLNMSGLRVVRILGTKPLRSAVPCNGCVHRMGLQMCSTAKPKFGQYLFQGCINLAEVTLSELPSSRGSAQQVRTSELAPGCLRESTQKHFVAIGARACDSCRLLTGEALCGGAGFCWGFWTPNWCPEKSLFLIP